MKVKALECVSCRSTIYSRANHDFRSCPCGAIFVDGGLDPLSMRTGWKTGAPQPDSVEVEVDATKKELYDDWNLGIDHYGLIPAPSDS